MGANTGEVQWTEQAFQHWACLDLVDSVGMMDSINGSSGIFR